MFSAFFGNYLLNKGVVTRDELKEVLADLSKTRLKLGVLAMDAGYMTSAQVNEINHLQATLDQRFGELALQKGFLTDEQLIELLSLQKSEHLLLAQGLIDRGILTTESFETEIMLYKLENGLDDDQFEAIKNGDVHVITTAFMAFEKSIASGFYIDFVSLFVKSLIRFVDTFVQIDRVEKIDRILYTHLFSQHLLGEEKIFTAFSGEESALLAIASKTAGEVMTEIDDYAIDACGEFLNQANGLFVVNLSDQDIEYDLTIQAYTKEASINPHRTLYRIPIHLSSGMIYLMIGHLEE